MARHRLFMSGPVHAVSTLHREIHLKRAPSRTTRAYIRVPASVALPAEKGRADESSGQFCLARGDRDQDGTTYHVWRRRTPRFPSAAIMLGRVRAFFSFFRIPGPLVIDELLLVASILLNEIEKSSANTAIRIVSDKCESYSVSYL